MRQVQEWAWPGVSPFPPSGRPAGLNLIAALGIYGATGVPNARRKAERERETTPADSEVMGRDIDRDWGRDAAGFCLAAALRAGPGAVIIAATHAPGLSIDDAQVAGHVLHGHSHDEPEPGRFGGAHDAAYHEHQTKMILPQTTGTVSSFGILRLGMLEISSGSVGPSSPKRPPKGMSVSAGRRSDRRLDPDVLIRKTM